MIQSRFKFSFLFSLLGLSIILLSFKKNDPFIQQIIDYFTNSQGEFPIEKVHLHIDNDSFTLGDDVWFSAYVTAGGTQVPSPLSKTLYVYLFDPEGKLISERTIFIENGFGHGDFKLPDFGVEGAYTIKAYTAWMENFGEEYFYHQEILVFDGEGSAFYPSITFTKKNYSTQEITYSIELEALTKEGASFANQTLQLSIWGNNERLSQREILLNSLGQASLTFSLPSKPFSTQWIELSYPENENRIVTKKIKIPYAFQFADIQFLPEGGNLLKGFTSTVAFKGVYPDGSPVEFTGEVLDQEEANSFQTIFGGMGKFDIQPMGTPLKVKVQDLTSDDTMILTLPEAKETGIIAKIINNPNQAYITVYVQGNIGEEPLTLVSHSRGVMNLIANGNLPNSIWSTRIQKRVLQQGINHITILTQEGKPLVERLFFYWNNEEKFELAVSKKNELSSRSLVTLEIGGSPQSSWA